MPHEYRGGTWDRYQRGDAVTAAAGRPGSAAAGEIAALNGHPVHKIGDERKKSEGSEGKDRADEIALFQLHVRTARRRSGENEERVCVVRMDVHADRQTDTHTGRRPMLDR